MRPRYGPWPPMNGMPNGMRPPMRGRGGGPCGPMRGMGPRPPPFQGMGPPMRHFGPPPMGPRGPHNRGGGPMMPRMRPPPPHMMPPMMRPTRPMRPPVKKANKMANNDGKIKKKKLKFRSFYVTRPWVNDELRAEITKKDKLFDRAKGSNKADDWAAFKEQKDKCVHMYSTLKLEFIGQHPEEVFSPDDDESNDSEDGYVCEPCDRAFDDGDGYQRHMQEHQACGIDGCKFNAHELLVMAHIKMQHSSGLYDKIRNISTPEDIKKWREERRKRYPSKANIEQRYKQQEEMLKRGERIGPNKDRFGRTKGAIVAKREKLKMKKKRRKAHLKKTADEPVSLIDEKADWNGDMFPFRGTAFLQEEENSEDETKEAFSDDEWGQDECENVDEPVLNNALGALIGAYQSDESDDEQVQTKTTNNKPLSKNLATNNVPTVGASITSSVVNLETNTELNTEEDNVSEVKILKEPVDVPDKATEMKGAAKKRTVPTTICNMDSKDMPIPPKRIKKTKREPRPQKITYSRKPTLLQKLLDKEIRHERNVILQCVRFIINNNFFDSPMNNSVPIQGINSTCQESHGQQSSETNTDNPELVKTEPDCE